MLKRNLWAVTSLLILFTNPVSGEDSRAARYGLPDFRELVQANASAVVNISTKQDAVPTPTAPHTEDDAEKGSDEGDSPTPFDDFMRRFLEEHPGGGGSAPTPPRPGDGFSSRSLGSGFVIDNDGHIMTCAHVIADADAVIVRLSDRRELEADVIGMDRRSDVALLKVDAKDLNVVTIGDPSLLQVGEWVLAIGSPFGFNSSATAGIVSATGRSLPNESYVPFIQTDVAINPGNSGGPLFDLNGDVIGINAQIYSRTGGFMGLSFAVPIDLAMHVAQQLRDNGRVSRGWLGVAIQEVDQSLAESFGMKTPRGALIAEVIADGPAADSELQAGDVIVSFNNTDIGSVSDLPPVVGLTPVGVTAPVEVMRNGEVVIVDVVVGELDEQGATVAMASPSNDEEATSAASLLGMVLEDIGTADSAQQSMGNGVRVVEVESGPASRAGIEAGDIILQFDAEPVDSMETLKAQIDNAPSDKSIPVLVRRGEQSLFLALKTE